MMQLLIEKSMIDTKQWPRKAINQHETKRLFNITYIHNHMENRPTSVIINMPKREQNSEISKEKGILKKVTIWLKEIRLNKYNVLLLTQENQIDG